MQCAAQKISKTTPMTAGWAPSLLILHFANYQICSVNSATISISCLTNNHAGWGVGLGCQCIVGFSVSAVLCSRCAERDAIEWFTESSCGAFIPPDWAIAFSPLQHHPAAYFSPAFWAGQTI